MLSTMEIRWRGFALRWLPTGQRSHPTNLRASPTPYGDIVLNLTHVEHPAPSVPQQTSAGLAGARR